MLDTDYKRIFTKQLKYYMDLNGKTQTDLMNDLGLSSSTVSSWCTGTKLPRMGKIQMLADYFNINKSDLIEDKGICTNSVRESSTPYNVSRTYNARRINVYGRIPAGVPLEAVTYIIDWEEIPGSWTGDYIALQVQGDSMEPEYRENDVIIVRVQPDCESGQDCVVYVNGYDATLKRIVKQQTCIMLQPLNHAYEPKIYDYADPDGVTILGVVVEMRRRKG